MLRRAVEQAVASGLSPEAKDTLAAARRGLDLPESTAAEIAVEAYAKKLKALAPNGKIPSEEQVRRANSRGRDAPARAAHLVWGGVRKGTMRVVGRHADNPELAARCARATNN
jgi:uncharacterized protein (DUF2126 family)